MCDKVSPKEELIQHSFHNKTINGISTSNSKGHAHMPSYAIYPLKTKSN